MGDVSNGQHKRKGEGKACKIIKRKWTPKEDAVLIAALGELCNAGWRRENGIFKNGYTAALETKLKAKIPGCNIKASPHIESRLKLLKRQYDAITEMQGVANMQWDGKHKTLICEDDDVWGEWVQAHSDAKGLRNKPFPYYNDLHILFGNRGTRKGTNNDELDSDKVFDDENNNATTNLIVDDSLEEEEVRGIFKELDYGSYGKEGDPIADSNGASVGGDNNLIQNCKKRKSDGEVLTNASKCSILPDHEGASGQSEDSDDDNNQENTIIRTETQPHASTIKVLHKKSCDSDSGSSELGELAKMFGSFLEKYQEHLSLLTQIVGKEAAAEKMAGEKRDRLNEELKNLPNLNLQARLRAASLIVSDPAKLDLFYSLSKEERVEWVSMLLTGLV